MATPAFDLEPMSIGDILDRTVRLYRWSFLHNLGIVAVPYILLIPLGALAASVVWVRGDPWALVNPGVIAIGIVVLLAFIWLNFMSMGALARSVSERFLGRSPGVWDAYGAVARRTLPLLWVYILAFLAWGGMGIVGAGLIWVSTLAGPIVAALVAVGVVVAAVLVFFRFLLVTQVIVIENVRGPAALRRSWTLMRQNFWRALLVLIFSVVVAVILSAALNVPGSILARMIAGPAGVVIEQIVGQLAQILVMPFGSIAFTLLYYDSRIRKEAFDLEVMAQNLGVSGGRVAATDTLRMADAPSTRSEPPRPFAADQTLVTSPSAPPPSVPPPPVPRRPVGAFKVCPKCAAQVPLVRPACPACGTPVPFRSGG